MFNYHYRKKSIQSTNDLTFNSNAHFINQDHLMNLSLKTVKLIIQFQN